MMDGERTEAEGRGRDPAPAPKHRVLLKGGSLFNVGWELKDEKGKIISSLVRSKKRINKSIVATMVIVGLMMAAILFLILITSDGIPYQVLFIPLIFVSIIILAIRTAGTMVLRTGSGEYEFRSWIKKGTLNTPSKSCVEVNSNTVKFEDENGRLLFDDGAEYLVGSSAVVRKRGSRSQLDSDFREVHLTISKNTGMGFVPELEINDRSSASSAEAEILLYSDDDAHTSFLMGYGAYQFHLYKTNPNYVQNPQWQVRSGGGYN